MKKTVSQSVIAVETAIEMVLAALNAAKTRGISVSVVICGTELQLIAAARGDGAAPHSIETATRKAQSAASRRKPSGTFDARFDVTLALASGNLLTNLLGGLPIVLDGVCVGGIGVGGGSPDEDVLVAQAAFAVIDVPVIQD